MISTDGNGISMRREDLREVTRKAAEQRRPKLAKRLSKGEKTATRRMAQVAAATGVIEGTCRHLVKDRMDLTGVRWGLASAEAVLRALWASGDFDDDWAFHEAQEFERNHRKFYANHVIPSTRLPADLHRKPAPHVVP